MDIVSLLKKYSEETGLKFKEIIIKSFYDVEEQKGKHHFDATIRNPFN